MRIAAGSSSRRSRIRSSHRRTVMPRWAIDICRGSCATATDRTCGHSASNQGATGRGGDGMSLLVKARREGRDIVEVTPQSAGWRYVGFAAHRLAAGESMTIDRPENEICIVVLGGTVSVAQRDVAAWAEIGERRDVFDDRAP